MHDDRLNMHDYILTCMITFTKKGNKKGNLGNNPPVTTCYLHVFILGTPRLSLPSPKVIYHYNNASIYLRRACIFPLA